MNRIHRTILLLILAAAWAAVTPSEAGPPDCTGISNVLPSDPDLLGDLNTIKINAAGAGLSSPVYVTSPPGDLERLFVVEQPGRIRIIDLATRTVQATPFLDIVSLTNSNGNEQGLLGLAFHPDYDDNGWFFVYHTLSGTNTQAVVRYTVSANPDVAEATSREVVLTIPSPFSNHNGGSIEFGPDGRLYIASGDGGSGCDPGSGDGNGQSLSTNLGKLLRINVDQLPYTTEGNPFDGPIIGNDEIWSYGLRNPYRISIDRVTGTIYMGDVGQGVWEEVDCGLASDKGGGGENYGWVFYEGDHCTNPSCGGSPTDCDIPDYVAPVHEYNQAGSPCSVIGGYVYRGCRMHDLRGTYFFADFCAAFVNTFRTDETCPPVDPADVEDRTADLAPEAGGSIAQITSFGEDERGEIYVVDRGGEVFKIIPNFSIMETSGAGATPFLMGDDWTFEELEANSDYDVQTYRVYVSDEPQGPFVCAKRISPNSCSNGVCSWVGGDPSVPAPGEALYYLATSRRANGEETPGGVWSDGTVRDVDTESACPL
jgi:glucose/arabinose dehydrogenase